MRRFVFAIPYLLAGLMYSGSVMWFAIPRLTASFTAFQYEREMGDGFRIRNLDRQTAGNLAINFERVIEMMPGQSYSLAAIAIYTQMLQIADHHSRAGANAQLRSAIDRELSWRPMQARVWWSLAYAEYAREYWKSDISRAAILKSIELRENAFSLTPVRLNLLLRHWPNIPIVQHRLLVSQFVLTWRRDPSGLISLAKNPRYTAAIRGALAVEPEILRSLDIALGEKPVPVENPAGQ